MSHFFSDQPDSLRIKICGITNPGDAHLAAQLGADAIGINFYPGSKRYLPYAEARGWIKEVPPGVARIAVMVNPSESELDGIGEDNLIDGIQLHGDERPEFCQRIARLGKPLIKAHRIQNERSFEELGVYPVFAQLFDNFREGEFGGTGEKFDWTLLLSLQSKMRMIVSGGLNPDNVGAAVQLLNPFAVDVSSGVESDPRRKDPEKLRAFIRAARLKKAAEAD